jgi:hypothetical protein
MVMDGLASAGSYSHAPETDGNVMVIRILWLVSHASLTLTVGGY